MVRVLLFCRPPYTDYACRDMLTRILIALTGSLAGGWMIFDGLHVILRGKYFGPDMPGPWSIPLVRLGLNPLKFGPMFILFGTVWVVCLIALLRGQIWGWYASLAIAIASLWYFPLGTLLSIAYLSLLCFCGVKPQSM